MKKIFIAISLLFSLTITSANAVEVTQEAKITGLYVAFFNRAADQAGLTYWTTTADNVAKQGGDVSSVFKTLSKGFATHPTFTSTYAHLNNEEFVTAIYKNALGRDGDAEGIAYWTDLLDRGMIRSDMVATFVELSMVTDLTPENYPSLSAEELATAQLRQDLITNKVTVALAFTHQLSILSNVVDNQNPEKDPAYIASSLIISGVTEAETTVLNATGFLEGIVGSDDPVGQINAFDSLGGDSLGEGVLEENDSGSDSSSQQDSGNSSTANSEGNTVDQGSADGSGGSDHQDVEDSPGEEVLEESNSSGQQDSGNSSTANSEGNTVDQGSADSSAGSDHQGVGDSLGEGVSEESNTSANIRSGNCITVSRPIVGQTLRYGNPSPADTSYYVTIQEWTIIEFSDTSSSVEIVMTGDFLNGIVNETTTYSISNNYMDITKYIQQSTINSNSVTTTIEFKPFQRIEIDTVCKDQTWTSSFELSASTTAANGANYPSATQGMTEHYTIESINETKSVAAGTFSTYRKRLVDENGATVVWWIDVETGAIVYFENYTGDGVLRGTMELLSIE